MAPNAVLEVDGEARLSDATDMGINDASLATKKYVDDATNGMLTSETDPQVNDNIADNYVPVWNDSNDELEQGLVFDNGTSVAIGTTNPSATSLLYIKGDGGGTQNNVLQVDANSASNAGVLIKNSGAGFPQITFEDGAGDSYIRDVGSQFVIVGEDNLSLYARNDQSVSGNAIYLKLYDKIESDNTLTVNSDTSATFNTPLMNLLSSSGAELEIKSMKKQNSL